MSQGNPLCVQEHESILRGLAQNESLRNVNIAFFTRSVPASLVVESVGGLLARARTDTADPTAYTPEGIPVGAASVMDALSKVSDGELADAVWERSMRTVTSGGLGVGRPTEPPVATPRDARVRLHSDVVVRQRLLVDGRRSIATQGHTLRIAEHPQVEAAVASLATGDTLDLAQWEHQSDAAAVPLLHAVLLRMSTWRAIDAEADAADDTGRAEPAR